MQILLLAAICAAQQPVPGAGSPAQRTQSGGQRNPPTDTARAAASLSGKVLVDGQSLAGVRIAINTIGSGSNLMETMLGKVTLDETTDDGKFRFDGLRSAAYTLRPMLTGYIVESGVRDAGGQQIYYRPGDFATIKMVKGGVITGHVFGEDGSGLVGISVRAMRIKDLLGRHAREVTPDSVETLQPFTTDDRGIYRIYGLEPGIYAVCAGGVVIPDSSGPFDNDSPVYYPGGPISAAMEVTVRAGQESSGIDISYRELVGHSISGALNGRIPSGTLFSGAAIMLSDATTGALQAVRLGVGLGEADNRIFSFSGVPDGQYEVTAIGGLMGDEMTAAPPRKLAVDGTDVTGIDLILGPLAEISGRVVLDSPPETEPRPECAARPLAHIDQSVILVRAGGDHQGHGTFGPFFSRSDEAIPNDKGEFRVKLISSGTYYLQTNLPGDDLYVRAMALPPLPDGRTARNPADGLDIRIGEKVTGVSITVARGGASLSGRLIPPGTDPKTADKSPAATSQDGKPLDKVAMTTNGPIRLPDRLRVIAVPAEPEAATDVLRYAGAPVQPDGSFAFFNMAPGRYYLLARTIPGEEWNNPGSLPEWFKAEQRKKLQRDAKRIDVTAELNRCAVVKDYALHYPTEQLQANPRATPKTAGASR